MTCYRCCLHLTIKIIHSFFTNHHVELTNLPLKKSLSYKYLETFGIGASLSGKLFSKIPGDLIREVKINRKVKLHGESVRGEHSTSFDAELFQFLRYS